MHISRVELENIKSHERSTFEFSRGSTAITGENGAGKTTILEAIAWTMFDVLDYKKEDFVRRGAKKGNARVTFESGLDEREYTVCRDTGTGYFVYDPQLKARIADKKDEVMRFLWQHLGAEPGTNLETLFKHAIGVPQGTFTAAFLATPADRKKTFDSLLRVEEYRRGAEELLKTQRYVENCISEVREKIARAEGELSRIDLYESEHKAAENEAASFAAEVGRVEAALAEKESLVAKWDERESGINTARSALDAARSELARYELLLEQRKKELDQCREAASKLDSVKDGHDRHIEVLGRIHELERERGERDRLRSEHSKVETAEAAVRAEERHVRSQLSEVESAHAEAASLRPKADEQAALEKQAEELRRRIAQLTATSERAASLDSQLEAMRVSYTKNKQELDEAVAKAAAAARVAELQSRESELVKELARLRASLERDELFRSEIQNGFCPILSARCLNLKEGQTLESFISVQFDDYQSKISVLEVEQVTISTALSESREAERSAARIAGLEERGREIAEEGKRLRAERDSIGVAEKELSVAEKELLDIEQKLRSLSDPRSRLAICEDKLAKEADIRERISAVEKNIERLESDRRIIVEQLEAYKDLDPMWNEAVDSREATAEAHRAFLACEPVARMLPERESACAAASTEYETAAAKNSAAEKAFSEASAGYDRERHLAEREELMSLRRTHSETCVRLENCRQRLDALAAELARLAAVRDALEGELAEKHRLDRVLEATVFIRDTLKEAAPLVARNYVWHISAEANQLFREITGNAERTLKWTEDYGICLEEGGHERPFQSLSGGEQMAAALSVRLALLKQLSDIRVAFFDEPTTNMDAERRENLAQQIGEIKHFDQLFVISHDDTFEGYMDHEVRVAK